MRRLAWTSLCAALAACTGTDIGNPVTDVELALYGSPPAGASVDQARVALAGLTLHDPADCAGSPVVSVTGPVEVDLLAADPPAALQDLAIPAGTHCRLALAWGTGGTGELAGASIALSGTRADATPFVIRSARAGALVFGDTAAHFDVPEGATTLFAGFDAAALLAGVDLDAATVGMDGVIHVEAGSNDTQLAAFDAALHDSAHLFHDTDHDGALSTPEHDPSHALADGH